MKFLHQLHEFFCYHEYMEYHPEHHFVHKFTLFFISFLFLNIVILDYLLFKNFGTVFNIPIFSPQQRSSATDGQTQNICPQACTDKISSVETSLSQAIVTSSQIPQINSSPQTNNQVKEYFVTIGSGTGASDTWQDVPGLQVTIDSSQYGKIKAAYYEVSVYVPNANQIVSVRLYDITDDHQVWYSDLTFNNAGTAQTQSSPPIVLEKGSKTYKVQMKTELKFSTNITSRIRIDTY